MHSANASVTPVSSYVTGNQRSDTIIEGCIDIYMKSKAEPE